MPALVWVALGVGVVLAVAGLSLWSISGFHEMDGRRKPY